MTEIAKDLINHVQDLFYRSKFNEVIQRINLQAKEEPITTDLLLIKANAYFELHQVEKCKEILETACDQESESDDYLYALARISHLDNESAKSKYFILKLTDSAQTKSQKFKATLGLANILFSENNYSALPKLIEKLCSFEPLERADERISLMIFLGNYYMGTGTSNDVARTYFKKALSLSSSHTWTYFITRSLYGLACVLEKENQHAELMWTLEILNSFVDESQQKFFSHLVNKKFQQYFTINTPIEFDQSNTRIFIKDKWVTFYDKPMLFKFLNMLHDRNSFVEKKEIAEGLWPEDVYKSRVHDPRIFDIAKRARNLIEAYDNQPAVLLSGRMGYKLASF